MRTSAFVQARATTISDELDIQLQVHSCPYSILRVIGTVLTPRIRAQLESYDFVEFDDLPDGFVAHKTAVS